MMGRPYYAAVPPHRAGHRLSRAYDLLGIGNFKFVGDITGLSQTHKLMTE